MPEHRHDRLTDAQITPRDKPLFLQDLIGRLTEEEDFGPFIAWANGLSKENRERIERVVAVLRHLQKDDLPIKECLPLICTEFPENYADVVETGAHLRQTARMMGFDDLPLSRIAKACCWLADLALKYELQRSGN